MGRLAAATSRGLAPGSRALSLLVVNHRGASEKGKQDERFMFQVRLELAFAPGFAPRPNWRGEDAGHRGERVADLQLRDRAEWPAGRRAGRRGRGG